MVLNLTDPINNYLAFNLQLLHFTASCLFLQQPLRIKFPQGNYDYSPYFQVWENNSKSPKNFVPNGTNEIEFCQIYIFRRPFKTDIKTRRSFIRTNELMGYYCLIPSGLSRNFK